MATKKITKADSIRQMISEMPSASRSEIIEALKKKKIIVNHSQIVNALNIKKYTKEPHKTKTSKTITSNLYEDIVLTNKLIKTIGLERTKSAIDLIEKIRNTTV